MCWRRRERRQRSGFAALMIVDRRRRRPPVFPKQPQRMNELNVCVVFFFCFHFFCHSVTEKKTRLHGQLSSVDEKKKSSMVVEIAVLWTPGSPLR